MRAPFSAWSTWRNRFNLIIWKRTKKCTFEVLEDRTASKSSSKIVADRPIRSQSESRQNPWPYADCSHHHPKRRRDHRGRRRHRNLSPKPPSPIWDHRASTWSAGKVTRVRRRSRWSRRGGSRRRSGRWICERSAVGARGRTWARKAWSSYGRRERKRNLNPNPNPRRNLGFEWWFYFPRDFTETFIARK